jgi:hypothetical protein
VLTQNPGGNVGVFVVHDQLRKRGARARSGPWILLPAEHAAPDKRAEFQLAKLSPITPHCCRLAESLHLLVCCIRMSSGVPSPQCAGPKWPPGVAAPPPGGYFLTSAGPTKKEAPEPGGARGAEVSTAIYCIHIPRAMKRAAEWLGIFRPVNEFEDTNVG